MRTARAVGRGVVEGRWYVVGHDRDRGATRCFRLSRVIGEVRPVGKPGEVQTAGGRQPARARVGHERRRARAARPAARCGSPSGRAAGLRRRAPGRRPDASTAMRATCVEIGLYLPGVGGRLDRRAWPGRRGARARRAAPRPSSDRLLAVAGPAGERPVSASTDRMPRLLALVPYLIARPGIRVDEAAARLRRHAQAAAQGPRAAVDVRAARLRARRPDRPVLRGRHDHRHLRRRDEPAAAADRRRGDRAAGRAAGAGRDAGRGRHRRRRAAPSPRSRPPPGRPSPPAWSVGGASARARRPRGPARRSPGRCGSAAGAADPLLHGVQGPDHRAHGRPDAAADRAGPSATSRPGAAAPRACGCSGWTAIDDADRPRRAAAPAAARPAHRHFRRCSSARVRTSGRPCWSSTRTPAG